MSEGESVHTGPSAAAQILAIAERGDRGAFTLLFARFAPKIKAFLIRRGVAPLAAEELTQEAMLLVWRKAGRFNPDRGTGEAWIFTIARNLAIDSRRRDHGQSSVDLDQVPEMSEPARSELDLMEAQEANLVRTAIGSLSSEQLAVVRLSFFDDRPHGEIAEQLGLPLGTVKSRLRLAMKHLRTLVEASR